MVDEFSNGFHETRLGFFLFDIMMKLDDEKLLINYTFRNNFRRSFHRELRKDSSSRKLPE